MSGSGDKASATLQRQFETLQEQQAQKLARRKQRSEEKAKSSTTLRNAGSSTSRTANSATSHAFGVDDDLGLKLAPPPIETSPIEEQQSLREQIRELKDETGRLYKLLSERDLEVRQLRKRNDQQKLLLENASAGSSESASLKIVELSKKARDLTAELEAERTRSKQWARKCMDMEADKQKDSLSSSGRNHGSSSSRSQQYSEGEMKASLEADLKSLQQKFSQSEQKTCELRNQCQQLKQELKMTQKALANEVGEGISVQSLLGNPSGWRGRAQQVLALQKKVTELKAQLQTGSTTESVLGDDLEREMMGSSTFRKPTANDSHKDQLRKMERERKEAQERMINEMRALEQDHESTKSKLEASKARCKVLTGEVKSLKGQMSTLLDKGKHDDELISALMKQQEQLRNLMASSSNQDSSEKAEYEKKIKDMQGKAQQDVNTISQLQNIVSEKETKMTALEEELQQLKIKNLHRAQTDGVNALFERATSRASTSLSNRPDTAPQDDGMVLASPTAPSSSQTEVAVVRETLPAMTPTGVPLIGPIPRVASRQSDRAASSLSERPASRKQSARDHPTNSSGDPGMPQITAAELQELHAQIQQYRSLCQAAEVERDKLAELVKVLQQRTSEATQQATDANKEAQEQKKRSVLLEKQLGKVRVEQQTGRTSGKRSSRIRGSTATLHELIDEESDTTGLSVDELQTRLEIQQDENEALKVALQSTLRAKEEDLNLYHEIMEQTKSVFLQGLRQFRAQ